MLRSQYLSDKNVFKIEIHGKFDLPVALEFRKAYLTHESSKQCNETSQYIIDLSQTSAVDSAAIGSLILWSDYMAQKNLGTVLYLINVNETLRTVFNTIEKNYMNIKLH